MKKVVALLLAAVMVFGLTACGNEETSTHEDNVIYIGGAGPLTGDYANYGLSVKYGAEIAVEEINAAGGINGMQIVYNAQDTQGDPESAVAAYGKLIDWGMDVSIGTTLSGEMASFVKASAEDNMFMISPSASADSCLEGSDNAFRICFYDSYQGIAAANYVKDNFPGQKVAVIYESDIDYSVGLYTSFEAQAKENGIEIVKVVSFNSTDKDLSTQVADLVNTDATIIFMPLYAAEASMFLSQAKNGTDDAVFGSDVYFFGCDGLDGILTKVTDNPKKADNVLMLTPFSESSKDEKVVSFVAAYQKKDSTGKVPDQFAADAYDAVYVIKAAIEAAGITKSSDITGDKITSALLTLKYTGITGTMTWEANGNTNKQALAVIYKDGVGSTFGE